MSEAQSAARIDKIGDHLALCLGGEPQGEALIALARVSESAIAAQAPEYRARQLKLFKELVEDYLADIVEAEQ